MGASRIKKGDMVEVIRGGERGAKGKVLRVIPRESRVIVEKVNYVHKHLRRSQQHPRGGRIEREAPLPLSNVMFICPSCEAATRVSFTFVDEGGKQVKRRQCKKCKAIH